MQTRGIATGVYRYIYPQKISLPYKFLCGYWLFFFSLTQDEFDMVPVCALARVSFTYLHTTIYTPQMKFLATPLMQTSIVIYTAVVQLLSPVANTAGGSMR